MLMSGALPAIVVLVARRSMAESPRWLLAQGRDDEASAAIQRLTSEQGALSGLTAPTATSAIPADAAAVDTGARTGTQAPVGSSVTVPAPSPVRTEHDVGCWAELFGRFKRNTWFGLLNYVFEGAPFYALSVFLPTILKQAGYSKTDTGIAVGNLLLQLTGLAGIVAIFFLVDRAGRRFVNYLGYAGVCLALVAYVVIYPPTTVVLLLLFAVIEAAVWLGPASTDNLLLGELWPTRIRATGAGVCAGAGRLSAVAGTLLLPVMIGHWGVQYAMIPFLVMAALGVANTVVLGVETRGRSLEALWGT
jgi:putative MFS transporter